MKIKLEIFIFVTIILILAFLNLPLESTDLFILPFVALVVFRLGYLIRQNELSVKNDVLNFRNSKSAIISYATFSAVAILFLWFFKDKISLPVWLSDNDWLWFMFIHTLCQEIIFRTYLVNRLKLIFKNTVLIALISGGIFGLTHFILPDALLVVIFTFVAGTVWSFLYIKYPNLIYVWLSHLIIDLSINFLYPL